jgi:hypothetical protein
MYAILQFSRFFNAGIKHNAAWRFFGGEGVCFLNRAFCYICVKNQQVQQLFIQFINYVW